MADYIAHSNFRKPTGDGNFETIAAGEKVSQSDVGATDEEWEEYIRTGAVSEDPYPDIPPDVAPATFYTELAGKVQRGEATKEEIQQFRDRAAVSVASPEATQSGTALAAQSTVEPEEASKTTSTAKK